MSTIERTVDIEAPPHAVFKELIDLHRLDRWSTITENHEGPTTTLETGDEFKQTVRVAGMKFPTEWRCVECDPPNAVAYRATAPGGGRLDMRQTVVGDDSTSHVELTVDYDLPGGFVGDVLDRLYVKGRNEREAEHSLQNLKDLVEGQQGGSHGNTRGESS